MTGHRRTWVLLVLLVAGAWGARGRAQESLLTDADLATLKSQVQAAKAKQTDPNEQMIFDLLETLLGHLQTLQERVTVTDGALASLAAREGDRVVPRILGNMALDEQIKPGVDSFSTFKDYFMRSIQGHVVIDNYTDDDLYVEVNGVGYPVPRSRTRDQAVALLVPFGQVRTQLFTAVRSIRRGATVFQKGEPIDPAPRTWGDETKSKWKVVQGPDGKLRLMLPLLIKP